MKLQDFQISIIGAGRLAWSLIPALQGSGAAVRQIISRNAEKCASYASEFQIPKWSGDLVELDPDSNLVILTVSDQAIGEVAGKLKGIVEAETVLVHTSGSIAMETLQAAGCQIGVFYPMQAFTRDVQSDFREIPLFLEGDGAVLKLLELLGRALSDRVYRLDSAGRLQLHLGAVYVCNFTNYLYRIAQNLMPKQDGMDFSIYQPLIRGHLQKVFAFGPENSQTGPAVRGDQGTMDLHRHLLEGQADYQRLYRLLSDMIQTDAH